MYIEHLFHCKCFAKHILQISINVKEIYLHPIDEPFPLPQLKSVDTMQRAATQSTLPRPNQHAPPQRPEMGSEVGSLPR